ncbi:MAG: NADH-quinone oxidoreductase subunit N [bacterium]|nr:NADH-quinone oxidoreductase subunit N [bacterium]
METSVVYEKISFADILSVWGSFLVSLFISIIGFLISKIKKNINISWISALVSALVILVFSVVGRVYEDPFQAVFFDKIFFVSIFLISVFSILSVFISLSELDYKDSLSSEFFFFLIISAFGAILMTSSQDFLTLFLSKELMSFPIYAMVYAFRDKIGVESALKYFVAGAIFSLIYLVGFSFFLMSEEVIRVAEPKGILGVFGIYLIIFSLLFKGGTAPFHFWVPDVYQGAPASVVSFAGSVVKFSSFVAALRVIDITKIEFFVPLEALAIISIVVGILGALVQKEIKRLVAYSSISHSGFIIFFLFSSGNADVKNYLLFYLATYGIATAGIFGLISLFKKNLVYLEDFVGLSRKHRYISLLIGIFILSFAGIPMTAGFFAKYMSFLSAFYTERILAVVFGAIGSIASLYFYFQPMSRSFMESVENTSSQVTASQEGEDKVYISPFVLFLISVLALILIVLGFIPGLFFRLIGGIPLSF